MISIRSASLDDAPAIAALLLETGWFSALNALTLAQSEDQVERHLEACLSGTSHSVFVVDLEGNTCGYISIHWLPYLFMKGPEGFISELFISPDARGRGLGQALLEKAAAEARARGCSRLSLLNGKHRESYERSFYQKHGWQERPYMANFVLSLDD
jgi:GNAT superfamily N-acetyltransferase